MKQTALADMLGVSQGRLGNWERGEHDPPGEIIKKVAELLDLDLSYFYGEIQKGVTNEQTNVYYKKADDTTGALGFDPADHAVAFADQRIVRTKATVVSGAEVWSSKNAQRTDLNLPAYLIGGRTPIKLQDEDPSIKFPRGTVLIFQPDDYPHPHTYLLVENVLDPDRRSIRVIDPDTDPMALISEDPKVPPLRLGEWVPVGYAWAEIQGAGQPAPRIVILPGGIGPSRR